jgi:VIT1/CCC1 family predicted Fe2+/Mn2+ transporter
VTTPQPDELQNNQDDALLDDHDEPHGASLGARLNWLRASVLGANDGIVSTAGVVVGVAGATSDKGAIMIAGIAALVAGAISMAAGEYVSVSTQRDSERSMLRLERHELRDDPEGELEELTQLYEDKGISRPLAERVARELTDHDALGAHAEVELGIDPHDLTNPWHAAWASLAAFTVGALLPLVTITFSSAALRTWVTVISVLLALALTGWLSARLGGSPRPRAMLRTVSGGLLAMGVTYLIGALVGTNLG